MQIPPSVSRALLAALYLLPIPTVGGAQGATSADTTARPTAARSVVTLTLDEAIALAERNNPQHLSTVDRRAVASWQRRSAYGALLPNVTAQFGTQYREGLQQLIAGQRFGAASDQISSSYDIGVQAQYNGATLLTPKMQSANVHAAEAAVAGSVQRLRTAVTQQYLNVLQQRARE